LVKTFISVDSIIPPDTQEEVQTITVLPASNRHGIGPSPPPLMVTVPSADILKVPEGVPVSPSEDCAEPVKEPLAATVMVARCHQGASEPDARLL